MNMIDELIHKLREELLKCFSNKADKTLFDSLVQTIQKVSNCEMCTLWTINNNSTQRVGKRNVFKSISVLSRKLKEGLLPYSSNDAVLELEGTFIEKTIKDKKQFHISKDRSEHKSQECLEKYNLNYFIGIPISDFEDEYTKIGVLNLCYKEDPKIENNKLFSKIISDVISSSIYHHKLYNMRHIMQDLVENYGKKYEKKGTDRNLGNIFYTIINDILLKYFNYEGASIFIWDSYNNYFKLLSTTGIIGIKNKSDYEKVYYTIDEGYTGRAAKEKKSKIYDKLDLAEKNDKGYLHKYREINDGKTMMVIPIFRPSNKDEVIGILRFVNKQNSINTKVVDFFNDADEEIISYASKYLALTIDYFLGEEERNNYISKLSHEFSTPANTISITADRLIKNKDDKDFMKRYFNSYMESILSSSELQIQQTTTNLYLTKIRSNLPRVKRYNISRNSIRDIIYKGKKTVVPIAREEGLQFDSIIINDLPIYDLFIDNVAFTTVFYNLLTNTIKYRKSNPDFLVQISGHETSDCLIINVSDYGIGIEDDDKDKIFYLGVRGQNTIKRNVGFGIGLHVIKQIINDFGGDIRVANLKSPTKFEIKLPKKLFNDRYTKTKEWNSK